MIEVIHQDSELTELTREILPLPWGPRLVGFRPRPAKRTKGGTALELDGIRVVETCCLQVDHTRLLA